MQFPSPDPLWLLELAKVIILFALGFLLLIRWFRAERRFYTDIPFLFAIGFFILAGAESVDVLIHSGLLPPFDLFTYKIRAAFTAISLAFFLYPTLLIWVSERRRLRDMTPIIYIILVLLIVALTPTELLLRLLLIPFMLVVYVGFTISFFAAWMMGRLAEVHGLIISIGGTVTILGQILKVFLPITLVWVSEVIEILGLIILWAGLNIKSGRTKLPPPTQSPPA
ncbi:MAG: hypothetical protein ACFE9D_00955 [Promethearchaeota archaeon]